MFDFKLKCVQLDLARQKENIPFIKDFIRFAADAGYDSILLYLEDRIRTAGYPYPSDDESYSVDEMRDIVKYSEQYNIELIPCVATLGHAERFLKHKELNYLSEVQDGMKDRFGAQGGQDVFCITNPDFYPFIEKYIAEVAEIFPSKYFHAGLDEFFNFNLCERCRAAMPDLAAEENMFLQHIIRINAHLEKLGKRMMMWSDMFEIYTTVISRIPKNIIMVDWQSQEDVRFYFHHLFDQKAEKRIDLNNSLGLDTVMAPAELLFFNNPSCLKYAAEIKSWGFMMTMWEKTDTFVYRSFPVIFYCGQLLKGKNHDEAWRDTVKYIFNCDAPEFVQIINLAICSPHLRHFSEVSENAFFVRAFHGLPLADMMRHKVLLQMLKDAEKYVNSELGKKVYKDLCLAAEERCIRDGFKENCWDIFDFGMKSDSIDKLEIMRRRFGNLLETKNALWHEFRTDIRPDFQTKFKKSLEARVDKFISSIKKNTFLRIRFCMTDIYVVNFFDAEIYANGKWQKVIERSGIKPGDGAVLFETAFPVEFEGEAEAVRLTIYGMGARGAAFVQLCQNGRNYAPSAILNVCGNVEHPENILTNDGQFAMFNNVSMEKDYHDPTSLTRRNCIEFSLKQL